MMMMMPVGHDTHCTAGSQGQIFYPIQDLIIVTLYLVHVVCAVMQKARSSLGPVFSFDGQVVVRSKSNLVLSFFLGNFLVQDASSQLPLPTGLPCCLWCCW